MPRVTRSLQPYFRTDGTKPLVGDLIIRKSYLPYYGKIKFQDNAGVQKAVIRGAYNAIVLFNNDESGLASLTCSFLTANYWSANATSSYINAKAVVGGKIDFYTTYGGNQICASLKSLALNNGVFEIPRAGDITVLASKILNFGDNPILYTPLKHICPFDLIGGATDVYIQTFPVGEFTQDMHIDKIIVSIDQPAGAGKTVTVTVSNGTDTMTVTITGDTDVVGSTTTNNFDLDVSAESLTLHYSQTAGGAAVAGTIICLHHYITNV